MLAQNLSAFIEADRIVQRHFTTFQFADHILKRAQRILERQGGQFFIVFRHAPQMTASCPRVKRGSI